MLLTRYDSATAVAAGYLYAPGVAKGESLDEAVGRGDTCVRHLYGAFWGVWTGLVSCDPRYQFVAGFSG